MKNVDFEDKSQISHVRISINNWKPPVWSWSSRETTLNVEGAVGNKLWRFGRAYANKTFSWQGRKLLSTTVNFWVIPGQHKVYRAIWCRVHHQKAAADYSKFHGRHLTAVEAWRVWIDKQTFISESGICESWLALPQ